MANRQFVDNGMKRSILSRKEVNNVSYLCCPFYIHKFQVVHRVFHTVPTVAVEFGRVELSRALVTCFFCHVNSSYNLQRSKSKNTILLVMFWLIAERSLKELVIYRKGILNDA